MQHPSHSSKHDGNCIIVSVVCVKREWRNGWTAALVVGNDSNSITLTQWGHWGGGGSRMRKGEENWRRWGHATDVWRKVYAYSRLHMQRRDVFIQHVTSSGRVAAKWRADHLMRYINSCVYRPMMQSANPIHRRLSSEQHPLKKERKETACQ
jgi:hypothetical protein